MAVTTASRLAGAAAGAAGSLINKVGSVLGNPLPELKISEKLQNWGGNMNPFNPPSAYASNQMGGLQSSAPMSQMNYSPTTYSPAATQQVYKSGGSSRSQSTGMQFPTFQMNSPTQPFAGGASQTDIINQQFNDFNNYLDSQEQAAQSNFNETKGLYDTSKANAEKQYATEKQTQTEAAKKTESLNLAKVRQLLSDLSQSNAARTAITGGGSAGEALAERFGRQAQQGLGNVMDQTQQAITRVNSFYDNAIQKLNETYNANITQARQQLDQNLGEIRYQRNQSATAKQAQTLEAWQNYYGQVNNAKLQAANFQAQYDLWKNGQDQQIAAIQPFNQQNANTYNSGVTSSFDQQNYQGAGLNQSAPSSVNPLYQWTTKKPNSQDDPYGLNNPFSMAKSVIK